MAFSMRNGANWRHDFPKLARESGFRFNKQGTRIRVDWRRISSIDVDRVIRDIDLSTIDENINDIAECCLENEYDVKILDPNFVKLFRLAQLAIEYLLYCKQYLDHSVAILKDELRFKIEENAKLNDRERNDRETIERLSDKLREKSRAPQTKLSDSHGEIHKCPQCPKTFISSVFMSAHLNRRHPGSQNLSRTTTTNSPIPDERYRAEAEKLHDEIKTLKERLNETERLIRKESDKRSPSICDTSTITSTEKRVKCDGNSRENETNERNETIETNDEEQHRLRYRREIKNFKDELFNEIRQNLNLPEKSSTPDNDDRAVETAKNLIRDQEIEIRRLQEQLYKRLTPDIEDIQVKLSNQEELWQRKIDELEKRHLADVENINAKLQYTEQSADRMRIDYVTKINKLERETREYREKFVDLADRGAPSQMRISVSESQKNSVMTKILSDGSDCSNENPSIVDKDREKEKKTVERFGIKSATRGKHLFTGDAFVDDSDDDTTNVSHFYKDKTVERKFATENDEFENVRTNGFYENRRRTSFGNNGESSTAKTAKIPEVGDSLGIIARGRRRWTRDGNSNDKIRRFDAETESEGSSSASSDSSSGSSNSGSSSESCSESESPEFSKSAGKSQKPNSETKKSRIEVKPMDKNDADKTKRNKNDDTSDHKKYSEFPKIEKKNTIELLNAKLRDLGVDPEWRGIPKATLKQTMETVKHHRNLNCKKYGRFDKIRQQLSDQVIRRLSLEKKNSSSLNELSAESKLEKFLINAKAGRTWKSLASKSSESLLTNRKTNRRPSVPSVKPTPRIVGKSSTERNVNEQTSRLSLRSKLSSPERTNPEKAEENRPIAGISRMIDEKTAVSKNRSGFSIDRLGDVDNDPKLSSRSYESVKNFRRYESPINSERRKCGWEGMIDGPETVVTSTPRRNEGFETASNLKAQRQRQREDDDVDDDNDDDENFSESPKKRITNRSVIKSTNRGSTASLVKKKVVFDLEHRESPENPVDNDNENCANAKMNFVESDCEISSINDEISDKKCDRDEKQLGNVAVKTFQSEKIAQISKQIEQQLSVARRKPVGSVEAMFADKPKPPNNERKFSQIESPHLNSDTTSFVKNATDVPRAAPRNSATAISDRRRSSEDVRYGSKDSNLDQDIDELLEIE